MSRYRIMYLLPEHAANFRDKAPKKPPYSLRESHYEEGPEVESQTPYELWQQLQAQPESNDSPRPIVVGDVVRTAEGELLVCNFWGFDKAEWWSSPRAEEMPVEEQQGEKAAYMPAVAAAAPG